MGPFNWVRLTNAPTSLHYRSEGGLCRLILSTRPLGEIRYLFSESPESLLKKKETFLVIWIMFYAIIIEARTCTVTNWLQLLTVFSVFLQFSFALARFIKEEKIKDLKVRKGSPNNVSQILTTFTPPIIHLDPPPPPSPPPPPHPFQPHRPNQHILRTPCLLSLYWVLKTLLMRNFCGEKLAIIECR